MLFGELLKEVGVTQSELAKSLDVSIQLVSNWKRNTSRQQLEMTKKMACILKVPLERVVECFISK